jgi:hypothetical protein
MYCLLAVFAAALFSTPGVAAARPDLYSSPPLAIADLDGDHKSDVAIGLRTGDSYSGYVYHIKLALSGPNEASYIIVSAPHVAGLVVAPIDVDGDRDLDLVITSQPFRVPIGVWINDGSGVFERGDINHYSDTIWSATSSLEPSPLCEDDDPLDTNEYFAFHSGVFARAQILDTTRHDLLQSSVVLVPLFCPKFAEHLRAPPNRS